MSLKNPLKILLFSTPTFIEEESDAAVALFGCDCVKAINALRQLRGIPIGVEGDRILPGPMIRPCTQRLPEA